MKRIKKEQQSSQDTADKSKRKRKSRKDVHRAMRKEKNDKILGRMLGGNRLYIDKCSHAKKTRSGRKTKYTPKQLMLAAIEYFDFVENTPFYERKCVGTYYGEPMLVDLPKRRPMTIDGMLLFLDMSMNTWYNVYKKQNHFKKVTDHIEMIIKDNKYSGAATGLFNANLVIRDLGLTEKKDITTDGKPIQQSTVINNGMSVKEAEKAYKDFLRAENTNP